MNLNSEDDDQESFIKSIILAADQIEDNLRRFCRYACPEPLRYENVNLSELCRSEITEYQARQDIQGAGTIGFQSNKDIVEAVCDLTQIKTALSELLDNALQATCLDGQITVNLIDEGSTVSLEVEDNGSGIPEPYVGKILGPFFSTWPGRSGLGLPIVENIARAHHGTLELSGLKGRGTKASMILPRNNPEQGVIQ
jgi:signal transduction histidine kinase